MADAGILYQPNTADALAKALEQAFSDSSSFNELRNKAILLGKERYNASVMVDKLLDVYKNCINN
ncbi:hypothetical protein [Mangrovibacterium marinum]|uniref:glycosyltransferase n=1 Tax=Mangrovibacterium marinum TaxID=1639118 RepID=UPI002A18A80F|nr:hypothetical protein [Mangrovibacterium marinum]